MRFNLAWAKTKTFRNYCLVVVGGLAVFSLGVLVGNGRLSLGASHSTTGLPSTLNFSSVNQVYQALRDNYDGTLTAQQVINGIKHGIANAPGDPYTEYFTASEAKSFNHELNGSFTGIGAELGQDKNHNLEVMAPLNGSPASKAGLRAQDIIATINGEPTAGMSTEAAVTKIRGPKGSKVTLGIVRGKQQLSITITRADVQIPTVSYKVLNGNVGYMQISQFSDPDTFNLAQKAVTEFKKAHVKGIVLDLRDNPGGEVDAAVNVSSLWLKQNKLIMQEKRGSTVEESYQATGDNPLMGIPTVVLVNGGSASASEITAAALHDNGAATIMGEKSFGKGVVQQVIPFSDGSELKVTIAKWYRPNGKNINKIGIMPDKVVKMTDADYKAGRDPQLTAALSYLK